MLFLDVNVLRFQRDYLTGIFGTLPDQASALAAAHKFYGSDVHSGIHQTDKSKPANRLLLPFHAGNGGIFVI